MDSGALPAALAPTLVSAPVLAPAPVEAQRRMDVGKH
jgi:hypothetical protein